MSRERREIGDSAFILDGPAMRIRWMRYRGAFPARVFLECYPDDFSQFIWRAEEMARTGTISTRSQGHQLKGPYRELHQFNMSLTRSWGFKIDNVYVVAYAATKKKTKEQEADYGTALTLRANYFTGPEDD